MKMYYPSLENNDLLYSIETNYELCKALIYMVSFKMCETIQVTPYPYSIEIRGDDEIVSIIIYVGFEKNEYLTYASLNNVHIVSFDTSIYKMFEFESIKKQIKFIDPKSLFFMTLELSEPLVYSKLKFLLKL